MTLNWKPFKIHLPSFYQMLENNVSNADGINACEENFFIVEKLPLTEQEQIIIMDYYDLLTEEGEQTKFEAE